MSPKPERRFSCSTADAALRSRCRYCPATLVWVDTSNGRKMPLEYDSREPVLGGGYTMLAHWARCPGADQVRRTRPIR